MQYLIDYTETLRTRFTVDAPANMPEEDMWRWLDNHEAEYAEKFENTDLEDSETVVLGYYDDDRYRIVYSADGNGLFAYRWFASFHACKPSGWELMCMGEDCEGSPYDDPIAEAELINKLVKMFGADRVAFSVNRLERAARIINNGDI